LIILIFQEQLDLANPFSIFAMLFAKERRTMGSPKAYLLPLIHVPYSKNTYKVISIGNDIFPVSRSKISVTIGNT